jgi:hypothetical protein
LADELGGFGQAFQGEDCGDVGGGCEAKEHLVQDNARLRI